jgi:hypothetical protein
MRAILFWLLLAGSAFAQGGMGPGPGTAHTTGGGGGCGGSGSWTCIAHTTFSTSGANGGTSSAIDCTTANVAVLVIPYAASLGSISSVSDSSSNSWTLVGGANSPPADGHSTSAVYTVISPTVSASQTFTVASSGGHPGLIIECWKSTGTPTFAGGGGATPAGASGTVSSQISASTALTTTGTDALVFAVLSANDASSSVFSIDNGYTVNDQYSAVGGGSIGGAVATKVIPSVATTQPTWTLTPASTDGTGASMAYFTP